MLVLIGDLGCAMGLGGWQRIGVGFDWLYPQEGAGGLMLREG